MINPDKYIRAAYISSIQGATDLGVFDNSVPMPTVLPDKYVILSNQSKEPFSRDKCGYEWLCRIDIDIYSVNAKGANSSAATDDIEQQVLTAINQGIAISSGFSTKFTRLIDTYNFTPVETDTETINRKRVIIEHWLNYVTS
jgi:hypothetical protein